MINSNKIKRFRAGEVISRMKNFGRTTKARKFLNRLECIWAFTYCTAATSVGLSYLGLKKIISLLFRLIHYLRTSIPRASRAAGTYIKIKQAKIKSYLTCWPGRHQAVVQAVQASDEFWAQIKLELLSSVQVILTAVLTLIELILKFTVRLAAGIIAGLADILKWASLKLTCFLHWFWRLGKTYPVLWLLIFTLLLVPVLAIHLENLNQPEEIVELQEPEPVDYDVNTVNDVQIKVSQLDGISDILTQLIQEEGFEYVLPQKVNANTNPIQITLSYTNLSELIKNGHSRFVQGILIDYCSAVKAAVEELGVSEDIRFNIELLEDSNSVLWAIEEEEGEMRVVYEK